MLGVKEAHIGVRQTAVDGSNHAIKAVVRQLLHALLSEYKLLPEDICAVYVSGMLTSNLGLYEIPHITAPASADKLAEAVKEIYLPEIYEKKLYFIPGIKNLDEHGCGLDKLASMDMMRGEEVEALPILEAYCQERDGIILLPGSHTKLIYVHEHQMIACETLISGELLEFLVHHCIISASVGSEFLSEDELDADYLSLGYKLSMQAGSLSRSAFLVRILNQFFEKDKRKCANFLYGLLLENDIRAMRLSPHGKMLKNPQYLIAGNRSLVKAFKLIFEKNIQQEELIIFNTDKQMPLSAQGIMILHQKIFGNKTAL